MGAFRALLLCCWVLLNVDTVTCCEKRLGGSGGTVTFSCDSNDAGDVVWKRNDTEIEAGDDKYEWDQRHLTVRDIVASDEGTYTCTFGGETQTAGCLLVYGEASFLDSSNDLNVSAEGTIRFDFSLTYSEPGPSLHYQTVRRHILTFGSRDIVSCMDNICTFDDDDQDHWWTVETGLVFVLHQAKHTDRGTYTAVVEAVDPKDDTTSILQKDPFKFVTSRDCKKDYPPIEYGTVSSLESTVIDINGAQANYSCNDGCTLEGSSSLRCRIVVRNHVFHSEWVNETGHLNTPNCSCPDLTYSTTVTSVHSVSATSTTSSESVVEISSSKSSSRSTTSIHQSVVIDTEENRDTGSERVALTLGVVVGIVTALVIITGAVFIPLTIILLKRRRAMKKVEVEEGQVVERQRSGPDDDQTIDTDTPENYSISHRSSDHDDNISCSESTLGEFAESTKNSIEAVV